MLGQPEKALLDSLLGEDSPPSVSANFPCVSINANYDVYLNIAEPAEWRRLGNLKTDGIDAVIKAYRNETAPAMKMNREVPIRELARRYSDKNSEKLYHKDDLVCRFLHQWGGDFMEGKY